MARPARQSVDRQPRSCAEDDVEVPGKRRPDETCRYQRNTDALFANFRSDGRIINNGEYMAKSTMMAIISRMSSYTGLSLTWEKAFNSEESLSPAAYTWNAAPPKAEVAVPGITPFA